MIQSILDICPPFLAHDSRLFECRTPLTENQTHIGMLQLEEDYFDIAQEEPEDIQGLDPEQCQIERRIREQQDEQRNRDNDNIDNDVLYGQFYNNYKRQILHSPNLRLTS